MNSIVHLRRPTAIAGLLLLLLLAASVHGRSHPLQPATTTADDARDDSSWDAVSIVCPTHCTCQRAHLRDLSIGSWTGAGADAASTASAWHLADVQPAHNHNEVTAHRTDPPERAESRSGWRTDIRSLFHTLVVWRLRAYVIRSPTRTTTTTTTAATTAATTATMAMWTQIRSSSRPCACCPITVTGKMCCYRCRRTCRPSCCCTTMASIRTSPVSGGGRA